MAKTKKRSLESKFLDWQCGLRLTAMRGAGGRPSPGMRPRVLDEHGRTLMPSLTVLIVPKAPDEATAFFRFQVMKSADPRETYEKAMRYLQAEYYQDPRKFSDRLLAVMAGDLPHTERLVESGRCALEFIEGRHAFRLPCKIKMLKAGSAKREAAIWHNRIFNPSLPDSVQVLAFRPDWATAETNF